MGQSGEVLRGGGRQSDTSLLGIFPALRIVPHSTVQHCTVVHCTPACAAQNADVATGDISSILFFPWPLGGIHLLSAKVFVPQETIKNYFRP